MWFFKKGEDDVQQLRAEIREAEDSLARAYAADPDIDELTSSLREHLQQNRLGERLELQWKKAPRRRFS